MKRYTKTSTRVAISIAATFRRLRSRMRSASDPKWPWAESEGDACWRITRDLVSRTRVYEKLKAEGR